MRDSDVSGIAIHIASRIASLSGPNQILVSRTVKDLVAGSGIRFAEWGVEQLAELKEPMELYMAME
jgi:class 3 adenylate cyclase